MKQFRLVNCRSWSLVWVLLVLPLGGSLRADWALALGNELTQSAPEAELVSDGAQQAIAGLAITSPLPLKRANQRLDDGLGALEAEVRSQISSYESWEAERDNGAWILVVNRITFVPGAQLDLDEAVNGTVEDITDGLEQACQPQFSATPGMVAGLPGRRLSLRCDVPTGGPVYVEGVLFSQKTTLWQVQVAFQNPGQKAEAQKILQSVRVAN